MTQIERMIDEACGLPARWQPDLVTLRCPTCRRTKVVPRHETDLRGTAVVESPCPECCHGVRDVKYFDRHGHEILEDEG